MKFETLKTAADVAARGADLFSAAVKQKPRIVAALPTGRTPIAMYERLGQRHREGQFSLRDATIFNLDEVLLPPAHPRTFFQFMSRHVWDPLEVKPAARDIPRGDAPDPIAECARYEAAIEAAGGLDLAILGIGADGHIAYNLPHQVKPRTHIITLDPETLATLGGDLHGPVQAITMGVETILSAKTLWLLATGSSKADAVRRMCFDPRSEAWPCTFFRDHPDLTVIADAAAAAHL